MCDLLDVQMESYHCNVTGLRSCTYRYKSRNVQLKALKNVALYKVGIFILFALNNSCKAFTFVSTNFSPLNCRIYRIYSGLDSRQTIRLFTSANDNDVSNDENFMRRLKAIGVSVSEHGFLSLLSIRVADEKKICVIPVRITSDQVDALKATSVEALTYIQLLGYGIDMASAGVFPPRMLQDLIALHCTGNDKARSDEGCSIIQEVLGRDLPDEISFYEANPWLRARVNFPNVELLSVRLELSESEEDEKSNNLSNIIPFSFVLECLADGKKLDVFLRSEALPHGDHFDSVDSGCEPLQAACYQYGPASAAFTALSLSLRYRATLSLSNETFLRIQRLYSSCIITCKENEVENTIEKALPRWRSTDDLKGQTERVEKNLMRGFEANKLEGALRIALEKGDDSAAKKIREKLGKYDSFDDLPTITESSGVETDAGGFQ